MSYQIQIVKDAEAEHGLRIAFASGADHIPGETILISGHHPVEGTHPVGEVGLTVSDGTSRLIAHARGGYFAPVGNGATKVDLAH